MDNLHETIGELLRQDPLQQAEEATGKSYKADDGTVFLGMFMAQVRQNALRAALEAAGDTRFTMTTEDYIRVIEGAGFVRALAVPFANDDEDSENLFFYWKADDGLLLTFDTYYGNRNSGKCYFNLRLNPDGPYPTRYSGGVAHNDPSVICGDIDCREALLYRLNELRACGEFLP